MLLVAVDNYNNDHMTINRHNGVALIYQRGFIVAESLIETREFMQCKGSTRDLMAKEWRMLRATVASEEKEVGKGLAEVTGIMVKANDPKYYIDTKFDVAAFDDLDAALGRTI